jgi:threonine dehydrogenase-like Zn-dependent dehydrogenase
MKATYYNGRADVRVGDLPEPKLLKDGDAIVRVTLAGICGADLEFTQNGPELGLIPGMRLGHEFVGIVEAVGKDVHKVKVGDRVVASGMFVDGECFYCKHDLHPSCEHGGLFGSHLFIEHGGEDVQGGQSEFVRVPHANGTLFKLPEGLSSGAEDEKALPLGDNFATGYHGATMANIRTGETVVITGDGAVGQCAVMAATLYGPSTIVFVGRHDDRLALGAKSGATHVVNAKTMNPVEFVKELTHGRGAESIIDTIGNKTSLNQTFDMARAGASISVIGFGHLYAPVEAPYSASLFRNLRIHVGIVPVGAYMRKLLPLVERGRIDPSAIFTHKLPLVEAEQGYALMRNRLAGSIKVALRP